MADNHKHPKEAVHAAVQPGSDQPDQHILSCPTFQETVNLLQSTLDTLSAKKPLGLRLQAAAEHIAAEMNVAGAAFYLWEDKLETFHLQAHASSIVATAPWPQAPKAWRLMFQFRQKAFELSPSGQGFEHSLAVPLWGQHHLLGVLALQRSTPEPEFTAGEISLAQVLAKQAGLAVEAHHLTQKYDQVQKEAYLAQTLLQMAEDIETLQSQSEVLDRLALIVSRALKFKQTAIFLWEEEREGYVLVKTSGLAGGRRALGAALKFGYQDLAFWSLEREDRTIIAVQPDRHASLLTRLDGLFEDQDLRLIPLIVKNKMLGVIMAAGYNGRSPYNSSMDFFLKGIGTQAAIALNDVKLVEALDTAFWDVIKSLATTIEAKDHYTHSHSQSVAIYGTSLARALGLPKKEVDKIAKACLLHDLGKIGIADEILKKQTPLSPMERTEINKHPVIGQMILNTVHHFNDIALLVKHHHEKVDGTGYPDRLKGEEIPLYARIIQIADSFDAMTSDRPYRKALNRREAVAELKNQAGHQFDEKLVDVFLTTLVPL